MIHNTDHACYDDIRSCERVSVGNPAHTGKTSRKYFPHNDDIQHFIPFSCCSRLKVKDAGKRIFRKISHSLAPSTRAESSRVLRTDS